MAQVVYLLCAVTSVACAWLVFKTYLGSHNRLLLWTGIGFTGFAVNNLLLFANFIFYPDMSFLLLRVICVLIGLLIMIYGLVRDATL